MCARACMCVHAQGKWRVRKVVRRGRVWTLKRGHTSRVMGGVSVAESAYSKAQGSQGGWVTNLGWEHARPGLGPCKHDGQGAARKGQGGRMHCAEVLADVDLSVCVGGGVSVCVEGDCGLGQCIQAEHNAQCMVHVMQVQITVQPCSFSTGCSFSPASQGTLRAPHHRRAGGRARPGPGSPAFEFEFTLVMCFNLEPCLRDTREGRAEFGLARPISSEHLEDPATE